MKKLVCAFLIMNLLSLISANDLVEAINRAKLLRSSPEAISDEVLIKNSFYMYRPYIKSKDKIIPLGGSVYSAPIISSENEEINIDFLVKNENDIYIKNLSVRDDLRKSGYKLYDLIESITINVIGRKKVDTINENSSISENQSGISVNIPDGFDLEVIHPFDSIFTNNAIDDGETLFVVTIKLRSIEKTFRYYGIYKRKIHWDFIKASAFYMITYKHIKEFTTDYSSLFKSSNISVSFEPVRFNIGFNQSSGLSDLGIGFLINTMIEDQSLGLDGGIGCGVGFTINKSIQIGAGWGPVFRDKANFFLLIGKTLVE